MMTISRPVAVAVGLAVAVALSTATTSSATELSALVDRVGLRVGLSNSEISQLRTAVMEEPDAQFWAVRSRAAVASSAQVLLDSSRGDVGAMRLEAALRQAQFLCGLGAFLPEVRESLGSLGYVRPGAQRAALRHLITQDQVMGLLAGGAFAASERADDAVVAVMRAPADAVSILPTSWSEPASLRKFYASGLRSESRSLMGSGAYEEALEALLELRSLGALNPRDRIAVARCFSETDRAEDAVAIVRDVVSDPSIGGHDLLDCGDIALAVGADSLALSCYRLGEAAFLRDW